MKLLSSFSACVPLLLLSTAALAAPTGNQALSTPSAELELVPFQPLETDPQVLARTDEQVTYLKQFKNINLLDIWHDWVEFYLVQFTAGLNPVRIHQKLLELRKKEQEEHPPNYAPFPPKLADALSGTTIFMDAVVLTAKGVYEEQTKSVVRQLAFYNDHHEMNILLETILSEGEGAPKVELVRNAIKNARWAIHLQKDQIKQDELEKYNVEKQVTEKLVLLLKEKDQVEDEINQDEWKKAELEASKKVKIENDERLEIALSNFDDDERMIPMLLDGLKERRVSEFKIRNAMQEARHLPKTRVTQLLGDLVIYSHPPLVRMLLRENDSTEAFETATILSMMRVANCIGLRSPVDEEDWKLLEYILNHERSPHPSPQSMDTAYYYGNYYGNLRFLQAFKDSGKVTDLEEKKLLDDNISRIVKRQQEEEEKKEKREEEDKEEEGEVTNPFQGPLTF